MLNQRSPHGHGWVSLTVILKMEPIIRAILDSNLPEIRRLLAGNPKVAWSKSDSGKTPAQVAYAAGNAPATVAILRNTPQCIDDLPTSPLELLEDLIGDFSESTLCSSWNDGIEFDLWALVSKDCSYTPEYERYLNIERASLDDIGWLASWVEGWIHWPSEASSPQFISDTDWQDIYRQKTKR